MILSVITHHNIPRKKMNSDSTKSFHLIVIASKSASLCSFRSEGNRYVVIAAIPLFCRGKERPPARFLCGSLRLKQPVRACPWSSCWIWYVSSGEIRFPYCDRICFLGGGFNGNPRVWRIPKSDEATCPGLPLISHWLYKSSISYSIAELVYTFKF